MILKKDNLQLGIVLGLIGPLLGLVVIYLLKFSGVSFGDFLDAFFNDNKLITSNGTLVFTCKCYPVYLIYKYPPR